MAAPARPAVSSPARVAAAATILGPAPAGALWSVPRLPLRGPLLVGFPRGGPLRGLLGLGRVGKAGQGEPKHQGENYSHREVFTYISVHGCIH